jgi:hypothetical protein
MHIKNSVATATVIFLTIAILGTFTISGTVFAEPPLDKDEGASGLAPGEDKGKEFPAPNTFAPGQSDTPKENAPGQIIGPDNPGETDEQSNGQIIGPDNPSETPGHEGLEGEIIGPD